MLMPSIAFAADFRVLPGDPGKPAIVIVTGEFSPGDEAAFVREVISIRDALVVFSSPGGSLGAGLEIGKAIRLKNFATYVPADTFCASACGLAWLGGTQRLMSRKAKIGFHAAYNDTSGFARESGMANAMVGAYLNSLGLPSHAVAFMTMASPDSMAWLSPQDATALGLNVEVFDFDDGDQPSAPATSQNENTQAPSDFAAATEMTKRVQQCLSGFRFYRGPINGLLDEETAYSITKFQRAWEMRETGAPTYELLSKCGIQIE
jgi:ATP-dependent protease ClpP protease subunit